MQDSVRTIHDGAKNVDEKHLLICNPNYSDMMDNIRYKMAGKPELGRILKDQKYDQQKTAEKEVALWAFVKEERKKEQEKLKEWKQANEKPKFNFNS